MILNLPEVSKITLEDKARIIAARNAYYALTDEEKLLVSEDLIQVLKDMEARILELEKENTVVPPVEIKPGNDNSNNNNKEDSNNSSEKLPQTGGVNSSYYVIIALILVAGGAYFTFKKKKVS